MNKLSSATIRLLSSSQVITSVSSAVKELVENALDAGATSLDVKLEKCGLNRIEVRDNGCGIKKSDTTLMAQRYYTSKISKHEDLESLDTYGFRGEALGSLCQVADVLITTKTAEDTVAVLYTLDHAGNICSEKPTHDGDGTIVVANNLFKNLPVRKQFYNNTKKCKEELKRIEDILMAYGLINPEVRVTLRNNKNLVWQKNKCCDLKTAMMNVFGVQVFNQLEYFELTDDNIPITLKCFVPKTNSDPHFTSRTSDDRCLVFVNKRFVNWKELIQVLKKLCVWQNVECSSVKFPLCLISLQLSSQDIDANLEPNKTRVLIKQKEEVLEIISNKLCQLYKPSQSHSEPEYANELNQGNITESGSRIDPESNTVKLSQNKSKEKLKNMNSRKITCEQLNVDHEESLSEKEDSALSQHKTCDSNKEKRGQGLAVNRNNHCIIRQEERNYDKLGANVFYQNDFHEVSSNQCSESRRNDCVGIDTDLSSESKKNKSNKSTTLVSSNQNNVNEIIEDDGINDLLDDLADNLAELDDATIAIDSPQPSVDEWSKGQCLRDKNGKDVEPVNILTSDPGKRETVKKSGTSLFNGKRKHPTTKDPSPRSSLPSKRIKRISKAETKSARTAPPVRSTVGGPKMIYHGSSSSYVMKEISGQSLLTSVLNSPKTPRPARTRKTTKHVSFSLSSLKQLTNSDRPSQPTAAGVVKLIKRLDPWGVWLVSRKRELCILNPYRIQEVLLYKRLLGTHVIPREKLGKGILLDERILGSASRYDLLQKIVWSENHSENVKFVYCGDERLVFNGFEICGKIDPESSRSRLEVTKMNTTIPYFGMDDLIEVLDLIQVNERKAVPSGVSDNGLASCRSTKVCNFLKDEVVRVSRGLTSRMTETDVKEILRNVKNELVDTEAMCIHNQPFFFPLTSY